jgi:hypothetical protein
MPYDGKGTLTFEPFFEQIFGNNETLKKTLEDFKPKGKDTIRMKAIILSVLDEFITSNKRPFKIKEKKDKIFLDNIMHDNGAFIR